MGQGIITLDLTVARNIGLEWDGQANLCVITQVILK